MHIKKKEAFSLRREKLSLGEISNRLGVAKSTLSLWFKNEPSLESIKAELTAKNRAESKERLLVSHKTRQEKREAEYARAEDLASYEFPMLMKNWLFCTGLAIYWGEGDKISKYSIRVGNIDPDIIRLFVKFLQEICAVQKEKIKAWLLLYPDLNEETCKKFWKERAGLAEIQFNKSIFITGRHKTRRVSHGVCYVGISSVLLKRKMLTWLRLLGSLEKTRA
ncbi:MAG: hypothetical protein AAB460_02640 [Patescibacteria group bacterium]